MSNTSQSTNHKLKITTNYKKTEKTNIFSYDGNFITKINWMTIETQ